MPVPAVIEQLVREGAPVVVPRFGGDALNLRTAAGAAAVLLDRRSRGAWAAAGGQSLGPWATGRADAILARRAVPPPLPEAAAAELREIVARAEARAGL